MVDYYKDNPNVTVISTSSELVTTDATAGGRTSKFTEQREIRDPPPRQGPGNLPGHDDQGERNKALSSLPIEVLWATATFCLSDSPSTGRCVISSSHARPRRTSTVPSGRRESRPGKQGASLPRTETREHLFRLAQIREREEAEHLRPSR